MAFFIHHRRVRPESECRCGSLHLFYRSSLGFPFESVVRMLAAKDYPFWVRRRPVNQVYMQMDYSVCSRIIMERNEEQ